MTLRKRADRILRGEILGQEFGKEGVGKFELSKSVRRTLMSPCPDWNRGSVTARARFRMVSGRETGRWRGRLAGKAGGKVSASYSLKPTSVSTARTHAGGRHQRTLPVKLAQVHISRYMSVFQNPSKPNWAEARTAGGDTRSSST